LFEQVISLYIEHSWLDVSEMAANERVANAARLTAFYLVCVGLTAAYVQGSLIGKLARRYGEVKLGRVRLVLLAISVAATPFMVDQTSYFWLVVSAVLVAF